MANNAVQVTGEFHKDVERVSKPKLQGQVVRHFQALFSPVIEVYTTKPGAAASFAGRVLTQGTSKRVVKRVLKKKKKK